MNEPADKKIRMMKASMRCLVFGLLALLPAIGLPFAVASLVISGRVRQLEKEFWNPSKTYRIIGIICAIVGTVTWLLVAAAIAFAAINNSDSFGGC